METLSKPCISRLARMAGVKSLSDDCYDTIRNLIGMELNKVVSNIIVINDSSQTKTIMSSDVYKAFELSGILITESTALNSSKKKL
jgi:histone H3/H4